MNIEQITTIATGVLQGGGVVTFLYFLINGLKKQIFSLNNTIEIQSKTLEVMERRIEETKEIGEIYRNLISDMPEDLKKYKEFIRQSKDSIIEELRNYNKEMDEKHEAELKKNLSKIKEQERNITELLDARNKLIQADFLVNLKLGEISDYLERENLQNQLKGFRSVEVYIQNRGNLNIYSEHIDNMKLLSSETLSQQQCNPINIVSEEINHIS
ncbi:hypothetical protein [Candidatus Electronema sp. JC]|uniref:hypothetical protein n=1 Tax=Candidatus Electronema sp. JC TaxID=3401570 RepID=UPI003B42AD02